MLDPKFIREHVNEVKENVKRRRVNIDVDAFLSLDDKRLELLKSLEEARHERNDVAEKMKQAKPEEREALIACGKEVKDLIAAQEETMTSLEREWKDLLLQIPNMTHPDAPEGVDDTQNKEIKLVGEVKKLNFKPKSHVELAEQHDLIDFERGAKVAGNKFYFLKGKMAVLEQALVHWVLKEAIAEGFTPLLTPDLARKEVLMGTGYNPRGPEQQIYNIEGSDLSLIATAEIPIGGYHMNEVLDEEKLPLKYVGLSHCFRMEGGAYGRESYGLYRVHQFTKVELFVFCLPEQSDAIHEELRRFEEMVFTKLGVPFRVVDICTGDLGGPAYRKYDLEAWMWGKNDGRGDWGEVTSASNCTDYQARRLNIKYKKKEGKTGFVHTLNGTALALSRAPIAILENNQQEDGSIIVPEVLRPYCGFDRI
ncbi:MAG TPA: serine--tRNA ligase [Patescibacteria group bacterium]|nr:serine--tRNA ligase [Patescibacteria group bacterium]